LIRFTVALPRGYKADSILSYHARDAERLCERVEGRVLTKAIRVGDGAGGKAALLRIDLTDKEMAAVSLDGGDRRSAEAYATRLLALDGDPTAFKKAFGKHPRLADLVKRRPHLRLGRTASIFEALTWAILGQQITVAFATQLRRDVIQLAGTRHKSGMVAHPTPAQLAAFSAEQLTPLKLSRSKADYLLGAARAVASGALDLDALPDLPPEDAFASLCALRGIGPWTAYYVLLRGAGLPDVAPIGDAGLAAALQRAFDLPARPTPQEQEALMAQFAPHRSLATAHLWASLAD
jgi:3-methyladenine DNA glycosylase/8-oxoguanine DNA glycosylase